MKRDGNPRRVDTCAIWHGKTSGAAMMVRRTKREKKDVRLMTTLQESMLLVSCFVSALAERNSGERPHEWGACKIPWLTSYCGLGIFGTCTDHLPTHTKNYHSQYSRKFEGTPGWLLSTLSNYSPTETPFEIIVRLQERVISGSYENILTGGLRPWKGT